MVMESNYITYLFCSIYADISYSLCCKILTVNHDICIMLRYILCFIFLICILSVSAQDVYVLGVVQDGGYPHMGCKKKCCNAVWEHEELRRNVVSLAVVDTTSKKWWLIEATPDIKEQLHYFEKLTGGRYKYLPEGIFVTHAHIGHYTGLMQLGREVMNTKNIPVYALPKMGKFLESNGPWSQLVKLNNITVVYMAADSIVKLTDNIGITPLIVPHRDEYSETAGFVIQTSHKKYLFIPDIDKWSKWQKNIIDEVKSVDLALLDGTFYDGTELPGRSMSEVPHPFIRETMELFAGENSATKTKVCFIHLNHTNPLLNNKEKQEEVIKAGFKVAKQGGKL